MTIETSDKVLSFLNRRAGEYLSGQEIADTLRITRTAVWKAIEKLRVEGYDVLATTNKGYALARKVDLLDESSIRAELTAEESAFYSRVLCLKEIDSTNTLAKTTMRDEPEGTVVVAETQTAGRGRFDRKFYCRRGAGVYFSLILRPYCEFQETVRITAAAAVAGAKACERAARNLPQRSVKIKWVNDLYLNEKKICGVLTEASTSVETGKVDFVVLGVGINVRFTQEDKAAGLVETAGALYDAEPPIGTRAKLVAAFLSEFLAIYRSAIAQGENSSPHAQSAARQALLEDYRARQSLLGRKIDVVANLFKGDETRAATAVGIDDEFRLLVSYDDSPAHVVALNSGEARARTTEAIS